MPTLPSFTKYYWTTWFVALGVYLSSAFYFPLSAGLGWFALVAGIGSVYVFHFEFGRLMGFMKVHCPTQHAELQSKRFVEALAFVHPSLVRTFWQRRHSPPLVHECVLRVYRSAWLFSLVTLVALIILANTIQ